MLLLARTVQGVWAERHVAAVLIGLGRAEEGAELPIPAQAIAEFDRALAAEPEPESANARLMRELGLT